MRTHQSSTLSTSCNGISLIEVVVVVGIFALLLSLLVPAISSSRESARRMNCQNNLRQLSAATHQFHEVNGHLPQQNFVVVPERFLSPPGAISVWGQLLQYLDHSSLFNKIDFLEVGEGTVVGPRASSKNSELLFERISVLMCPSETFRIGNNSYRVCLGTAPGTVYKGREGVFFSLGVNKRKANFAMTSDGLSQTVLFSEKSVGDQNPSLFDRMRDTYYVKGGDFESPDTVREICRVTFHDQYSLHDSFGGSTWLLNGYGNTWYNHVDTPNSLIPDCTNSGAGIAQGKLTARSLHPGGLNVSMADGSVRFVNQSIDLQVWRAIATRAGNETVNNW